MKDSFKKLFISLMLLILAVNLIGIRPAGASGLKMYVLNVLSSTISVGNLDGTGGVTLGNPDGLLNLPVGIALDTANSHMYILQDEADLIRMNLDGTGAISLGNLDGSLNHPGDLALDLVNGKMYIANVYDNNIIRANLDGTGVEDMGDLGGTLSIPDDIVLDLANNKMYILSYGTNSVVWANLDGTDAVDLGNPGGFVIYPYGLAVDLVNQKMYITVPSADRIVMANLDGSGAVDLGNLDGTLDFPTHLALDVANNKMYIASEHNERIVRANLDGTDAVSLGDLNGTLTDPYAIALDLDGTPPDVPSVTAPAGSTNDPTPTISGTAEANSRVNVSYRDQSNILVPICTDARANGSAHWSCNSSVTLPEGSIQLEVNAMDGSGNTSADTIHSFAVDLTAPAMPTMLTPVDIINDPTPTIGGTAEPGSRVNVWYRDNSNNLVKICTDVTVNGVGGWSCTSSAALPERLIQLTANVTDGAGNISPDTTHSFTLDLTGPSAPVITTPVGIINDPTPTINGTAEAGSLVNVSYDASGSPLVICENVLADGAGNWSCVSSEGLPEGEIELTANATDDLGQTGPDSLHTFTVDVTPPTITSIVRLDANNVNIASVRFMVNVSEAVTEVVADDFSLSLTGGISSVSITGVTGSGNTRTVTVNTGSGQGTLRLDVPASATITDLAGNALAGLPFNSGEVYTITASGGADTTGVFRPSNGLLYLKHQNVSGFADVEINYGIGGDYPVVGDWDGNGTVTIGVYRNGQFYLRNTNTIGFADKVFPFGAPGDQPIAGDWNGDGVDTIGVYRNGTFFLRNSNDAGAPEMIFGLGISGDVGIAGDWDGDGKDSTGVFRPSNGLLYLKHKNATGFADIEINYGIGGDKPVTGDWNNDGIDTIGVYRNGQFYLRNENTIGFADIVFALGIPGDHPIAGNWDGLP